MKVLIVITSERIDEFRHWRSLCDKFKESCNCDDSYIKCNNNKWEIVVLNGKIDGTWGINITEGNIDISQDDTILDTFSNFDEIYLLRHQGVTININGEKFIKEIVKYTSDMEQYGNIIADINDNTKLNNIGNTINEIIEKIIHFFFNLERFSLFSNYLLYFWSLVLIEVQGINEVKNSNEKLEYLKEAFCLDQKSVLIKYWVGSYFIVYGKEPEVPDDLKDLRASEDIKELCENKAFLTLIKELIKDQNLNEKIEGFFSDSFKERDGDLYKFCIDTNNCCAKEEHIENCLNGWNEEQVTSFIDWYKELCNILGLVNDKVMS